MTGVSLTLKPSAPSVRVADAVGYEYEMDNSLPQNINRSYIESLIMSRTIPECVSISLFFIVPTDST
jgi:RimJ/RimL family protein N-acetyltransferase